MFLTNALFLLSNNYFDNEISLLSWMVTLIFDFFVKYFGHIKV